MTKQKIKLFFKTHWLGVALALAVGLFMVTPYLLFIWQAGEAYQGFNIFGGDAEYHYAARVREVYDGNLRIANPFLSEGKGLPYVQQPLPELIMGFFGRILNLEIGTTLILFRFIGPVLLFFLIYFWVLSMTKSRKTAILAPIVVMFAYNLVPAPGQLWQMIKGTLPASGFTMYNRLVNPGISSLFLFGFLYSFWKLMTLKFKRYWCYCLGIFGLCFYVYPYTWSFLFIFLLIYLFIALLFKKRKEFEVKKIMIVLLGGLVLAIPYFINVYQMVSHSSYEFLENAQGVFQTREFIFSKLILVSLLILFLLGTKFFKDRKARSKKFFWFWLALTLTGLAVVNQQIITGRMIWYGHYHYYIIKPLAIILMVIFFVVLFRKFRLSERLISVLVGIIILICFYNVFYIQYSAYRVFKPQYVDFQKYGQVVRWLNENTSKNEVAYAPGGYYWPGVPLSLRNLDRSISVYTHLNVYHSSWVPFYLSPYPEHEYSWHNLFITLKILGVKPDETKEYIRANPEILMDVYAQYFKVRSLEFSDISQEKLDWILRKYASFYDETWWEIFTQYPIDYIVWDRQAAPDLPFFEMAEDEPRITLVYNKDDVVVFEFRRDGE